MQITLNIPDTLPQAFLKQRINAFKKLNFMDNQHHNTPHIHAKFEAYV